MVNQIDKCFSRLYYIVTAVVVIGCLVGGCTKPGIGPTTNTIAVTGRVPVIDVPIKPTLDVMDADELAAYEKLPATLQKKLQSNDKKLKSYAAQLLVGIEDYNTYAAIRNKTSEDSVGVKGAK